MSRYNKPILKWPGGKERELNSILSSLPKTIENYYEPINYDANPDINRDTPTTTNSKFRFPISKSIDLKIHGF